MQKSCKLNFFLIHTQPLVELPNATRIISRKAAKVCTVLFTYAACLFHAEAEEDAGLNARHKVEEAMSKI